LNLLRYALRRLVFAVLVLASVLTITFVLSHLIPGNVLQAWLGRSAAQFPNLATAYAQRYHLTDPLYVQYFYYIGNMLQGNLGISPSRGFTPVVQVIGETLPFTLQIVFFAFLMALALGLVLGIISARYYRSPTDRAIRIFYIGGYSSPPYFIAVVLLIVFSFYLGLLPSGGAYDISIPTPSTITGLPMLDSLLEGNFPFLESSLQHVILPSFALALASFGIITRVARASLLEVMQTDFIRTARAKGLDENAVFYKHALPNAAVSLITISSLVVTFLITGTIFVESIFAYPGIGQYVVIALAGLDYPGVLATTLVFAIVIVTTNFVADVLYAYVDPQIRLG
jgi:peptide/nickel transport system permease protein